MLTQPDPKAPRDGLGSCEWIWALAYQRTDRPHTPHKPLITRAGGCGQSALEFGPCLAALPRRCTRRVSGSTWRHPPGNASRRLPDGYPGRAAVCRNRQPLWRLQPLPPGPRANPGESSKLRFIAPGDSPRSVPNFGAMPGPRAGLLAARPGAWVRWETDGEHPGRAGLEPCGQGVPISRTAVSQGGSAGASSVATPIATRSTSARGWHPRRCRTAASTPAATGTPRGGRRPSARPVPARSTPTL